MATARMRLLYLLTLCGGVTLGAQVSGGVSASAADAPAAKQPEVSTVGTEPYPGPLPEEIAKVAEVQSRSADAPLPAKEPVVATVTPAGTDTLTAAEKAKVAALVPAAQAPPVVMKKPPAMTPPQDGTPQLTPQEQKKHADEQAAQAQQSAPGSSR